MSLDTATESRRRDLVALCVVGSLLVAFTWLCVQWNPGLLLLVLGLLIAAAVLIVAPGRPEIGVVALVAAAALDVFGRVGSFGGVQVTLYQIGALALTVFAAARIRSGRSRFTRTPVDLPVVAFLLVAGLSVFVAVDPRRALVGLLSLVSSAVLVYVVVVLIDTVARARALLAGLAALGVSWGLLAFAEARGLAHIAPPLILYPDIIRARVTFDDPNVLGEFLLMVGLLVLPTAMIGAKVRHRPWYVIGFLVCFAGVLATASRGALVALLVGVAVVVIALRIPGRQKIALFVAVGLVVAALVLFVFDPVWLQQRVLEVAKDPSWMQRVYMFKAALLMAADHPAGIGAYNYPLVYPFYRVGDVRANLVESHTMLATVLVEYGLVGLILFAWIFWRYLSRVALATWRAVRIETHAMLVGALAAGVALLAQSFTYSLETSKFVWFVIGYGMSLWAIAQTESGESS